MAAPPHPAHPHGHSHDAVQDDAGAEQALADAGYTNVTDLKHRGRNWACSATNAAGATARVMLDGKDGRITEDTNDEPEPDPDPA